MANILFPVLFGVGTCLVVLFAFLPLINLTHEGALKASIDQGDGRIQRLSGSDPTAVLDRPPFGAVDADKDKANPKPSAASDSQKKQWESEKKVLQQDLDDSHFHSRQDIQVYTWGLLFGFLILAAAAVGLLGTHQPTTRKVLGAITLSAIVVFFLVYTTFYFQYLPLRP